MLDIPSYNPAPVSIPATSENPQNANFALTEFSEVSRLPAVWGLA
jgi:hypothetical protein